MVTRFIKIISIGLIIAGCGLSNDDKSTKNWSISILPSSIRLDPSTNEIIEHRFDVDAAKDIQYEDRNLLEQNWIYDGDRVSLHGARGEYISFQLIVTNNTDSTLKYINVDMSPFKKGDFQFEIRPELFLEWSVEVKTPSTGYPKASLGEGWYPDALIPFKYIQADSSKVNRRWIYPLWLPDFNNRIENQRSLIIWVDQYIPFNYEDAKPGIYHSTISVTIGGETKKIPIDLKVWNFAIPNENELKASLQQGFLSSLDVEQELEIYQLFKRNRISLMDPTYKPSLQVSKGRDVEIQWDAFDKRLKKYFTGDAFTKKFGYDYGPGYGEPIEAFILPFDVYGKHGTPGWPDIGKPEVERNPKSRSIYIETIEKVRSHLQTMINPHKTTVITYLNGLDESYFPEAWDRMVYYGDMFNKYYPETSFRIDGAYGQEAMEIVHNSIDSWGSHTLNFNIDEIKKYQEMGIKVWLYGPMLYESKVNSWVGSSTFLDLPLINDRAISWSAWKYNIRSWLSWGIAAGWKRGWHDPESWKNMYKRGADSDSRFIYKKLNGNALLIYSTGIIPNVDGVCLSIRLKTMRDGVEEYEYMRLLSELDGNTRRVDKIVYEIIKQPFGDNSIGNLDVWSYDAKKWDQARIQLGKLIIQAKKEAM